MAVPVFRLGLLMGGCVLLATGAYVVIYQPLWVKRLPWKTLSECPQADQYKTKWGGKYSKFLLGPKHKENKEFWKQQYLKLTNSKNKSGKFKKVTKPWGRPDDKTSLNVICDQAFKSDKSKITPRGDGEEEFNEWEVWAFCSTVGGRIFTLAEYRSEKYEGDDKYGSKYRDDLVATKDKNQNVNFWITQQEKLKQTTKWSEGSENDQFRLLHEKLNETIDEEEEDVEKTHILVVETLRDLCKAAYNSQISDKGEYPKSSVFKFCSLSGELPGK